MSESGNPPHPRGLFRFLPHGDGNHRSRQSEGTLMSSIMVSGTEPCHNRGYFPRSPFRSWQECIS